MRPILLFFTILLFSFSSYSQSPKDSLRKAVRERVKDLKESESDNLYYTDQEIENEYLNENKIFQTLAQPNENSDLSNYFKIYLEKSLLKKIDFSTIKDSYLYKDISNSQYNYTIRLTFEFSKKNKPTNFRINTGNKELDREVIAVFKKYPMEKLGLTESDKLGKISIQLFAKEDKKTIIKASTYAVVDQFPVVKDCENTQVNWEMNTCLYDKLYKYILNNISLKTIEDQKLRGEILFRPRFIVDAEGKIVRVNSIAPNKTIKDEIDRIIKSYDQVVLPGKRNNKPKSTYCDTYRTITIVSLK